MDPALADLGDPAILGAKTNLRLINIETYQYS